MTGQEFEDVGRSEDFSEKIQPQDQMESEWNGYFGNHPSMEFDINPHLIGSEVGSNNSEAYCNIWNNAQVKNCNSGSFAMDARIRLDNLKSGCNSPLSCCNSNSTLYNYNYEKDLWNCEDTEEEQSALDLVEILDIADDVQDEESWLYESPKKSLFVETKESALRWCRHVLDNPSPEMEAACRLLTNMLDQRSSRHFYRRPAGFHYAAGVSLGSSVDKTCVGTTHIMSDSLDYNDRNISHGSVTTSYRLQDITDVHMVARLQEESLRQDYVSMPSTALSRRSHQSPLELPPCFHSAGESADDCTSGNKTEASSSLCQQPALSSLSSASCQSPASVAKQVYHSPRLARLHQQVTQFKLLKLAQNQASPNKTRPPLQTSLRSLQAVRNSRSLEGDDCQPPDQSIYPPPGVSPSTRTGQSCRPTPLSLAPPNSSSSMTGSSVRATAMRKLQRSHSLSPCRLPLSAKGYMSSHGRVFASPDRPIATAWARHAPSIQR
ncbi:SLAIN motif-containing protein-like isoform X2 [Mugil cephalus]|uniref:SLAIN motif-containing protein-like isoform X2 n=1 Tax=Mugil cephalus TaxID=48193 RepID=UPI001FB7EDD1|nr:SLAIN motif-containing protein-like isoform X2 [Mugil cephalus]